MRRFLILPLFFMFLIATPGLSQDNKSKSDWAFFLDGYNSTDLSDMVIDQDKNTYFSANYSMAMYIPELDLKMPNSPHQVGALVKLDKDGKALWARSISGAKDSRILDMTIANNGDLLLTGFCDGVTTFEGTKNTIKTGWDRKPGDYHNPQFVYVARYDQQGEVVWVKTYHTPWGEGRSVACDSKGNIYWTMYHSGEMKSGDKVISDNSYRGTSSLVHIFKLNPEGDIIGTLPFYYFEKSPNAWSTPKVTTDLNDNVILFGQFKDSIAFGNGVSITNDSYYESSDAFIAKYDNKGKFLWYKKIGGQAGETIYDLTVDKKNRIYAVGTFRYECVISSGIDLIQRSKYEYKSGSSFFYLRLKKDGLLDFVKYNTPVGYNASCIGLSLALDDNGYSHIVGTYSDTMSFASYLEPLGCIPNLHTSFASIWYGDSVISQQRIIQGDTGWASCSVVRLRGERIVYSGMYFNKNSVTLSNGKKVPFSNYEHGRASFVIGGTIPDLKEMHDTAEQDTTEIYAYQDLPKCYSPHAPQPDDIWYPTVPEDTTAPETDKKPSTVVDCGIKIEQKEAKLYPNPTRGATTLELRGLKGMAYIQVISEKGEILLAQQLEISQKIRMVEFDVSAAADGMYYVSVTQNGYRKVFRLVKTN